jgi:hypothetical protein
MSPSAVITFEIIDDLSDDGLVTLRIGTSTGVLIIMGEPSTQGRVMIARGVHMHGEGVGPNGLGFGTLRTIADAFLRELDLDEIVVEGAVRTTGANPGTRPRPVRFARRPIPASRPGPGER